MRNDSQREPTDWDEIGKTAVRIRLHTLWHRSIDQNLQQMEKKNSHFFRDKMKENAFKVWNLVVLFEV